MQIHTVEVGSLATNCYFIIDEKNNEAAVVDPGAEGQKILNIIQEKGWNLRYILITHGHFDHIGGVNVIKKALNEAQVVMHQEEAKFMTQTRQSTEPFQVDQYIDEGQALSLGSIHIDTIKVPGHTNASICYHIPEQKVLIAGDTLFYHSIGTSAYYAGPDTDLGNNIMGKLFPLDPVTKVLPGHGPSTTIGEEVKRNPYLSDSNTPDPWEM